MYFKRIEIHGFKSFADPVVIEFDQGITCVVGPNGSGKSNISDAIRWVLGEQSPKTLRGDKMEDVIFAGTQNRKMRGMAEVTLVIDNSTSILPVEFSEVAITRRLFRSGESEYEINNSPCRMRDIRDMIMDTGIGVDGYSLIGQGKISEIISNKTESIREIFEETAGIVSYRTSKKEAERKLEKAGENLDRVCDIIAEIEDRIDGLREDSEKASEYLELSSRYKELEVNIILRNIERAEGKVTTLRDDVAELARKISEGNALIEELEDKLHLAKEERRKLEIENKKYRDEMLALTTEMAEIEKEEELSGAKRESLANTVDRLHGEIDSLAEKIANGETEVMSLREELGNIRDLLTGKRNELAEVVEKQSGKEAKIRELTEGINSRRAEAFSISLEMTRLEEEKASVDKNINSLADRLSAMEDEKSDESSLREEMVAEHRKNEERANEIAGEIEDVLKAVEEAHRQAAIAEKKRKENFSKVEKQKVDLGAARSRRRTLEEMESSYEGYQAGVRHVMRADLPGIEGVVGNLIDVPTGMEVAIETALGGGMQNIVCTTDRAAKGAIEELKRTGAGRATLLPIESIRPRKRVYEEALEDMVGFVDYALDAIHFDDRHRKPMEYLLGNILIFNNLDNAMEAAKSLRQSFRIVTLDGEVINASGAVTGGHYRNKRANILERKSDIDSLQNVIENLLTEIDKTERMAQEASKQEGLFREEAKQKTEELGRLREEQSEVREMLSSAKTKIESMNQDDQKRSSQLMNLVEQQNQLTEEAGAIKRKYADKKASLSSLEKEIEDLEEKLESESDEVSDDSEGITDLKVELESLQEKERSKLEIISRRESDIAYDREQQEEKKTELAQVLGEIDNLSAEVEDNAYEAKKVRKVEIEELLEAIENKLSDCDKTITDSEVEEDETRKTVESLQGQKHDLEIKITKNDGQVDSLKDRLWEEFEISYAEALDMQAEDFVISRAVQENRKIKSRLRELGDVNVGAIEEYEEVNKRYSFLTSQRDDIQNSMDELNDIIRDMEKIIRSRFSVSFKAIVENFKTTFTEFFGGGQADIVIEDESNPLESDIFITAQPPGKQLTHINLLSGGEKTMTAIALMFAVLKTKPTPCCILDEVDAALDDNNIVIFADYLKHFPDTQFTIITHQKDMMEKADVMYGITMPERGVSKVLSLNLGDIAKAQELIEEDEDTAS